MNNFLPTDIMSMILELRTIEMKKDKEVKDNRFNFSIVMEDLTFIKKINESTYYDKEEEENYAEDPDSCLLTFSKGMLESVEDFNDIDREDKKQTEYCGCWVNNKYDLSMY